MKEVAISEFKAKCLGMLEQVRKTRKPIRITRFGKPVAEIVPPTPQKSDPAGNWLIVWREPIRIVGDIVGPISSEDDWEAVSRMNLLLDTHIWIWSVGERKRLTYSCRQESLTNTENQFWLSPISVWEVLVLLP